MEKMKPRGSFVTFSSRSLGGNYKLGWDQLPNGKSRRGVNAVARTFLKESSAAERAQAEQELLEAKTKAMELVSPEIGNEVNSSLQGAIGVESELQIYMTDLLEDIELWILDLENQ